MHTQMSRPPQREGGRQAGHQQKSSKSPSSQSPQAGEGGVEGFGELSDRRRELEVVRARPGWC
ncbi:hypothetical protein TYRP_023295 [Tyrophagus putrescentiae]|nr:hypothetical protein TYRP_023295 [Tyrophagus putrescentiae]